MMDECCIQSLVGEAGFRVRLTPSAPGARHTCPTCGQVYQLVRLPALDTPTHQHYEWKAVTH